MTDEEFQAGLRAARSAYGTGEMESADVGRSDRGDGATPRRQVFVALVAETLLVALSLGVALLIVVLMAHVVAGS